MPPSFLQVVLHPDWGSAVYPATLFANAPLQALQDALAAGDAAAGLENGST